MGGKVALPVDVHRTKTPALKVSINVYYSSVINVYIYITKIHL